MPNAIRGGMIQRKLSDKAQRIIVTALSIIKIGNPMPNNEMREFALGTSSGAIEPKIVKRLRSIVKAPPKVRTMRFVTPLLIYLFLV